MKENRCIMCGDVIPEGRMICPKCEFTEPSFNTAKVTVLLKTIKDISAFAGLASKCIGDVIVRTGNYAVNAKSIMGLLSLDLTKPLEVEFYGRIPYDVRDDLKKFIIEG